MANDLKLLRSTWDFYDDVDDQYQLEEVESFGDIFHGRVAQAEDLALRMQKMAAEAFIGGDDVRAALLRDLAKQLDEEHTQLEKKWREFQKRHLLGAWSTQHKKDR